VKPSLEGAAAPVGPIILRGPRNDADASFVTSVVASLHNNLQRLTDR